MKKSKTRTLAILDTFPVKVKYDSILSLRLKYYYCYYYYY